MLCAGRAGFLVNSGISMGFFSRKKTAQAGRSTSQATRSSDAQAAELRARARRRLVGALVLVLTAVVVVPWLFDDPVSDQPATPVVMPAGVPPVTPAPDVAALTPSQGGVAGPSSVHGQVEPPHSVVTPGQPDMAGSVVPDTTDSAAPSVNAEPAGPGTDTAADTSVAQPSAKPEPEAKPEPATKPDTSSETTTAAKPQPKPSAPDDRTDDGSVALAILEGRIPPSTSGGQQGGQQQGAGAAQQGAQQQGSFALQVAAYSTEADAAKRRAALVDAGVTNAYVEQAVSNNRQTFRLRVGPFSTRDAAQAAQARLRALGYDNSLLLTQ